MASAPPSNLPLLYNDLMPLNSRDHSAYHSKMTDRAPWLTKQHAIPLTSDEFVQAQRHFPIVFSSGEKPLPLALMGLNEGMNAFVDDEGKVSENVYIAAYIRRYPFMLAKLQPDSEELSLCFDPTSDLVGEFSEGDALFNEQGEASEQTKALLSFCEQFEQSAQRTQAFVEQLMSADLLMDGEVSIQTGPNSDPVIYRGFKMVDQEKLAALPDEKIVEFQKNGIMMLIAAHLFSLDLMRFIYARQIEQGKMPAPGTQPN